MNELPNPSAIRAVLADFGGVLYQMPDPRRMLRWLRFFGVRNPGPVAMTLYSPAESQLVMDLMTGRLVEQAVWEQMAQELGIRPEVLAFFRRRGLAQKRLDRILLDMIAKLRPRYRTAILTNAGSDFRATFVQAYQLEDYFDQVIISAEEGLAKPDHEFFQLAVSRLGITPQEALFFDDNPENVESARELGMQAFLHNNRASTLEMLAKALS